MSIASVVGRLGALVLALLMVVGALAWRDRGDGAPSGDGAPTATADPTGSGDVVCARELGICDALADALAGTFEVRVADGVTTARELQAAAAGETWVTLASLVALVEEGRDRAGRPALLDAGDVAATSPLVLVGWQDRLGVLEQACGAASWACVGEVAAGTWEQAGGPGSWGVPKPGHGAPDTSGIGLLVAAQAAADRLGTTMLSSRALDDGDFAGWFRDLERAVPDFAPASGSVLREMLQFGPSRYDVAGTTAAEAADLLARAGRRGADLRVVAAPPATAARVVVATPVGTAAPDDVVTAVTDALVAAGWEVPGRDPAVTLDPPITTTPDDATFTGGMLEALLLRWERIR